MNLKKLPSAGVFVSATKSFWTTPCKHDIVLFLRHSSHGLPTVLTRREQLSLFTNCCLHASAGKKLTNGLKPQKFFHEQNKSINSLNIPFYLFFLHFWLCDLTPKYITYQCVGTLFQLSFILFLYQQILLQGALTIGLTMKASSTLSLLSSETLVDTGLCSLNLR